MNFCNRLIKQTSLAILSLALLSTLSACISLTPPERPAYTGQDNVSEVDQSQLIGSWVTRELNPYPDSGTTQETTIEYLADGSMQGSFVVRGEGAEMLKDMTFEVSGNWQLNGDLVSHTNVEVNSSDGNTLGALLNTLMKSTSREMSGTGNVYELSADRIVMVGEDGTALEYTRQ